MHDTDARCSTDPRTAQSVPETSRCTLAIVQALLRFRTFPALFLAFHGYMECLNAEVASQSLPTREESHG